MAWMSLTGMDPINAMLATFSWAASWEILEHVSAHYAGPENILYIPRLPSITSVCYKWRNKSLCGKRISLGGEFLSRQYRLPNECQGNVANNFKPHFMEQLFMVNIHEDEHVRGWRVRTFSEPFKSTVGNVYGHWTRPSATGCTQSVWILVPILTTVLPGAQLTSIVDVSRLDFQAPDLVAFFCCLEELTSSHSHIPSLCWERVWISTASFWLLLTFAELWMPELDAVFTVMPSLKDNFTVCRDDSISLFLLA